MGKKGGVGTKGGGGRRDIRPTDVTRAVRVCAGGGGGGTLLMKPIMHFSAGLVPEGMKLPSATDFDQ